MTTTQITLDIATAEGKTWLARITGLGGKFGIEREFINAAERNTSRSGMTGSAMYVIGAGAYESNEGRRRLGRRYWVVTQDGELKECQSAQAAVAAAATA